MLRAPVRDLLGKHVFLTGAASGIGRATALAAAREGAVLFLTDVDEPGLWSVVELIRQAGGEGAYAAPADVSDHEAVRAMAPQITDRPGSKGGVLQNARV